MKNIIIILFVGMAVVCFGQKDLPSEEVEVIKDFDARLADTEKVNEKPSLPPLESRSQKLEYDIPAKAITVDYLPPKIRPIAMRPDKLPPAYNGHVKLGYGLPSSPYIEASYFTFSDNKFDIGGLFKHHSANYKNLEHQRFMENGIGVKGTYYMPEGYALKGNADFTSNQVHYYGYNHDSLTFSRDEIKQNLNTFELGSSIFNGERTSSDLNYNGAFNFYTTNDNYATHETGFELNAGVTKWFNDKHPLGINLRTDFTRFRSGDNDVADTLKQELDNFYLSPHFTYHADQFKVKLGVDVASHKDEFTFFPQIEATANIVGNKFTIFAAWEGGFHKNTLRSLSDYNPFIATFQSLNIQNTKYNHFYGGLKGTVGAFNYLGQIGYKKADNLPLYVNDYSQGYSRFNVVYDTVDIFNIQGTVSAEVSKGFEVGGTLSINSYSMTQEEKAWHLPNLESNFFAHYLTMEDKLKFKAELFIADGVPYKTDEFGNSGDNLNTLFDINLGAEYAITDNIGAFIDINNLFNNKRERWYQYPTYGTNLLVGITGKF